MLIIQLTGLSGSGKTTLSQFVKILLEQKQIKTELIDGDKYRETLCRDLGFSKADRYENIRRLGKLAYKIAKVHDVVIIAAINPYEEIRRELKLQYAVKTVWINCPLDELIKRDTKGLYKRALLPDGHPDKVYNLTGVNDDYDIPSEFDMLINTHTEPVEESAKKFHDFILTEIK